MYIMLSLYCFPPPLTSKSCHGTVTCNGLGIPTSALEAATKALATIHHYPAADQEPARTDLAAWLFPEDKDSQKRVILGNGASELIDLVTRGAPRGAFRRGPSVVQYKEYERSAKADGRSVLEVGSKNFGAITAIINPCNPTGDFLDKEDMKAWIEANADDNSVVMVDESMIPWQGPEWREHSLVSATAWVQKLAADRNIKVWIMHSWTKIWDCPGIRLGSVTAPTVEDLNKLKSHQVPWSVNSMALAFTSAVVKDEEYMKKTWELTSVWRKDACDRLNATFPDWKLHGENWLSWIWIDTGSPEVADAVVEGCRNAGMPLRHGKYGYLQPTFIRIAARTPEHNEKLLEAMKVAVASLKK